jgi:hypothetical protein
MSEDSLKFIPLIQPSGSEAVAAAESLLEGISDQFIEERISDGKTRRDFAIAAANITEDRYSAGSTAARAALAILLMHGLEAAREFVSDLEHHEH